MNIKDKLLNIKLPYYCDNSEDTVDPNYDLNLDYLESDIFLIYYNKGWALARLAVEIKEDEGISNNTLKKLYESNKDRFITLNIVDEYFEEFDINFKDFDKIDFIYFSEDLENSLINKEDVVSKIITTQLQEDGQFNRYFDNLLIKLNSELRGKTFNEFEDMKSNTDLIIQNEIDLLNKLQNVINHRLQILNEEDAI